MFERYTQEARRTIFYARNEAVMHGAPRIECVDLLLGLTCEPYVNSDYLQSLYAQQKKLRDVLQRAVLCGPLPNREIGLSEASKKVVIAAMKEANADRSPSIDRDHLLRALLKSDARTVSCLREIGLSLQRVRQESKQIREGDRRPRLPWWKFRVNLHRVMGILLLALFAASVAALWYLHQQN